MKKLPIMIGTAVGAVSFGTWGLLQKMKKDALDQDHSWIDLTKCSDVMVNVPSDMIGDIKNRLKDVYQRAKRGYSDNDRYSMNDFLSEIIPDMIRDMRYKRQGSPVINSVETSKEDWDRILDDMLLHWKNSKEETCPEKNEYKEEYEKASDWFTKTYGWFGEGYLTEEERQRDKERHVTTFKSVGDVPEYRELAQKYFKRYQEIELYRSEERKKAMHLLAEHLDDLWD